MSPLQKTGAAIRYRPPLACLNRGFSAQVTNTGKREQEEEGLSGHAPVALRLSRATHSGPRHCVAATVLGRDH